jgi:hypothetical protein
MTAPPPTPAAPPKAGLQRRDIVRQVGTAIGDLAKHLATNEHVARSIEEVTQQAKSIAFKAWQAMAGGADVDKMGHELFDDLTRLADDMAALADRAGKETIMSKEAASVLGMAAAEFDSIAADPQVFSDIAALRARLRPLLTSLDTIPERLVAGKAIAQAFSESAKSAATLAARGERLSEGGKSGRMLQAVYDSMTDLASQTGQLSTWITANAERGHQVATMMASRVEHLSKAPSEPPVEPGGEKLSAVIGRGAAIVW